MGIDFKALRQATGMSEEEFANKVGVSPQVVKAWEAGSATPDPMTLKIIFALVKKAAERGQ